MISLAGLGRPSLVAALVFACGTVLLSILGTRRARQDLIDAGRRSLLVSASFVGLASVALVTALFARDFSLEYVANYSSRSLSGPYTLSAFWGGMEGSLLFWTLLLAAFSGVAVVQASKRGVAATPWAASILAGISIFFIGLLLAPADPFTRLADVPIDGRGLNPLLQSPGMMIHPPLLYTGFVGFSIPFAFALGALLAKRPDRAWFVHTRRWTLFSWSALSVGIVLGGAWAYTELGWGGYWAWDPVENASFMPWLTATAFLHSVVIQEKRQMFKAWNVSLILLTYVLAIFGTFLTRSGLLSSIHTFTEGPIGKWFLPFLAMMLLGGFAVIAARADQLRAERRFDSLLSREAAFLANNVLFVAAAGTVLWGTIYPIVAELMSGTRLSVGPPFFNSVFVPIGLAILGLTGIGPLISWKRMSRGSFVRVVRLPLAVGAASAIVLAIAGVKSTGALLACALCSFTATAILSEFVRGSKVHRRRESLNWPAALARTIARNRRRYGGYIVHLGVVLIVIGFAGSAARVERHALVKPGDSMDVGSYTLTYDRWQTDRTSEKRVIEAQITVRRGDDFIGTLFPQRNFHFAQEQPQSEVAIRTNPIEDVYVVVTSFDQDGTAALRAFVNPLTWWIWAGAGVMLAGMSVLLTGSAVATASVPVPQPLSRPVAVTR